MKDGVIGGGALKGYNQLQSVNLEFQIPIIISLMYRITKITHQIIIIIIWPTKAQGMVNLSSGIP